MSYLKKIALISLLFFSQLNSAFSDELIRISKNIPKANQSFNRTFWAFRIKEYKDIKIRFFLSDDINKENGFKILQMVNQRYIDVGYGTYIIKDGIIDSFKVIECKHKVANILTDKKFKLYYTDQDLEFDYYLLSDNNKIKLWGYSIFRYQGLERKVNNIPVIIVNYNGFIKEKAIIRKYPSLDNNTVKYIDKNKNELDYVPKDTFIVVYARTKNKYQVEQSYNYWYLINWINFSEPAVDTILNKYVWIFADFVRYEPIYDLYNDTTSDPTGFPYD